MPMRPEPELLTRFVPFSECCRDQLIVLADHAWLNQAAAGEVLVTVGSRDEWDYYLLEGTLKLAAADGRESFVMSGRRSARTPLAHLQPRRYTIIAVTPVTYLRVQSALLKNLSFKDSSGIVVKERVNFSSQTDSPLSVEIYQDLLSDRLVLPSLPEVALKIRRMIEVEDAPVPLLARAIDSEPAISAKLVKAANGVLYHGQPKASSCARAVARLGLDSTQHLVMSFVLRSLFRDRIHTELLKGCARDLWRHSVEVAAISRVLARITPGLDAEQALLAGLLHDIGELVILSYADSYPEISADRTALGGVISQLRAEIGATVLQEWDFHASFVEVARGAEDWQRDHEGPADYCDVVQVAQLHSSFGNSFGNSFGSPQTTALPAPGEVPAFARLAGGQLDPALSMQVLEEAREQIEETRRLLLG